MRRLRHVGMWAALLCVACTCSRAGTQDADLTARMLASVVHVECDVDFQGDSVLAGNGTGFLVGAADHVVTNNHVVASCNPENRIAVLKEALFEVLMQEVGKGNAPPQLIDELNRNPELLERLKADRNLAQRYVRNAVERIAAASAKAGASGITQRLYVVVLGRSSSEPVRFDVTHIVWNSQTSNERARLTGVDIALLKLDRPVPGGMPVSLATGSSARVKDRVYAVGFPGASGEVKSNRYVPTMKAGIVSKLGGESPFMSEEAGPRGWKGVPVIETDAAISPGNSGGPLFNEWGDVLGINTFVARRGAGIGWAQDAEVLVPILQDIGLPLPRVRREPRGWMEENRTLVTGGSIAVAALVLLGLGAVALRRPRKGAGAAAAHGIAPAAAASLVGRSGQFRGVSIPVPPQGLVLGRDPPAEGRLSFAADSDLSRRHCSIAYDAASRCFRVTDLGSSNGTYTMPDQQRIGVHREVLLRPGQLIRLGRETVFELAAG